MSPDVLLLFGYIALALVFSFLCSIAEAVLLSITPSYIEEQKEKRKRFARTLQRLKYSNVDQSLAAILTLNTIAHTVGAIMAGAKATEVFGSAWFGLFSVLMTLAILFFSEIIPKTIGALYWAQLARPTVFFVNSLIRALYPIVWFAERFTKFISRGKDIHIFSRAEFLAMARVGGQTGHLSRNETDFIANLFRFSQTQAREVMVPRLRIVALEIEEDRTQIVNIVQESHLSRFPVYQGDINNIKGFVHAKDLLSQAVKTPDFDLTSILRQPLFVPEAKKVHELMRDMQQSHIHMAMVVDEYGILSGLVTTEDLLEELVGEIEDEHDRSEPKSVRQLRDGGYLVDALLSLKDLEDLLGTPFAESEGPYETLAGLILYQLGHLPEEGKILVVGDYLLTCVEVTSTAIRTVRIQPAAENQT
jgi:CBS domain containing-hemolysin-like protein